MKTLATTLIAGLVTLGTIAGSISAADAHDRRFHHRHGAYVAGGVGLATGLILGGILANRQPVVEVRPSGAHVRWCLAQYRTYDPATNTFIDRHRRVRYCASPFG